MQDNGDKSSRQQSCTIHQKITILHAIAKKQKAGPASLRVIRNYDLLCAEHRYITCWQETCASTRYNSLLPFLFVAVIVGTCALCCVQRRQRKTFFLGEHVDTSLVQEQSEAEEPKSERSGVSGFSSRRGGGPKYRSRTPPKIEFSACGVAGGALNKYIARLPEEALPHHGTGMYDHCTRDIRSKNWWSTPTEKKMDGSNKDHFCFSTRPSALEGRLLSNKR